jgi:transcriptional activator
MIALYRSDRHADALAAYDEGRHVLAEDLGLDPGPRLRALHGEILRGDGNVGPPTVEEVSVPDPPAQASSPLREASPPRPARSASMCFLPHDTQDFAGRTVEIAHLLTEARRASPTALTISSIDGMGGVGKTALAVHLGHLLAKDYPDGQYFIDLHGFSLGIDPISPEQALDTLLRANGVPPEIIPSSLDERSALWRSTMAGQRALVVLDNATEAAQVRPLLPGTLGALVITTSRRKLTAIDGAVPVSLETLPLNDAIALFTRIAGPHRTANEPENVAQAVELCGRLPLAIRIAAARLRDRTTWTVAELVDRLDTEAYSRTLS